MVVGITLAPPPTLRPMLGEGEGEGPSTAVAKLPIVTNITGIIARERTKEADLIFFCLLQLKKEKGKREDGLAEKEDGEFLI